MDSNLNPSMALYKREEKANFLCMNVVSCELTYEKYFTSHNVTNLLKKFEKNRIMPQTGLHYCLTAL